MVVDIYTDGGSKGNPGPAAVGIVAYINGKESFRHREDIGIATNNVAEYRAVLKALFLLKEHVSRFKLHVSRINFYSDSKLLVNQLNGMYKVKNKGLQDLIFAIRSAEMEFNVSVFFTHIPREQNRIADMLVNNIK